MIRVHHLNCVSTCPLGGMWMDHRRVEHGETRRPRRVSSQVEPAPADWAVKSTSPGCEASATRGHLTCHCLLVEMGSELVLIDTGFGLRDVADPRSRISQFFLTLLRPEFREDMTAIRQIERLGFEPSDVRHIVLTHLDFDHAGGLDDFPWARVHMLARERDHATAQKTWLDRQRFRPAQWSTRDNWRAYTVVDGGTWLGFEHVQALDGIPPEIVLVPLIGHTHGHAGIAVKADGGWLLQAGDAYFFHAEMDPEHPWCTPGLRLYQTMMETDREARLTNQRKLRALRRKHGRDVQIFCSHDVVEFERLAGRSARTPAEQAPTAVSAAVTPPPARRGPPPSYRPASEASPESS